MPLGRSPIERDNPFSPGGEIDKETREILKHSVIERDRVLIVDPSTPSHAARPVATHRGERGDDDGGSGPRHRVGFRQQLAGTAGCSATGSGDGDADDVVISIAVPSYACGKDSAAPGSGGTQRQQQPNGLCDWQSDRRPQPTSDAIAAAQAGNGTATAANRAAPPEDEDDSDVARGAKRRRTAKGGGCGSCLVV